jgi:hypothetical protein
MSRHKDVLSIRLLSYSLSSCISVARTLQHLLAGGAHNSSWPNGLIIIIIIVVVVVVVIINIIYISSSCTPSISKTKVGDDRLRARGRRLELYKVCTLSIRSLSVFARILQLVVGPLHLDDLRLKVGDHSLRARGGRLEV